MKKQLKILSIFLLLISATVFSACSMIKEPVTKDEFFKELGTNIDKLQSIANKHGVTNNGKSGILEGNNENPTTSFFFAQKMKGIYTDESLDYLYGAELYGYVYDNKHTASIRFTVDEMTPSNIKYDIKQNPMLIEMIITMTGKKDFNFDKLNEQINKAVEAEKKKPFSRTQAKVDGYTMDLSANFNGDNKEITHVFCSFVWNDIKIK